MQKIFVAVVALGALAGSAKAGLVCATPGEMKVLQSAVLQQQLMVAALSCRMSADYNRFVAAYRGKLVQSDAQLKAFFVARPRGENYNSYKTRIANAVSLKSLHDPRFCDSASRVFDMALGRGEERRGLVREPPQLIETGYEGCRNVDDKLIEAKVVRPSVKLAAAAPVPLPKPAPRAAPVRIAALELAKPVPTPRPAISPEAEKALALAPRARPRVAAIAPKPVPKETPKPPVKLAELRPVPTATPIPTALAPVLPPAPQAQRPAAPPDDNVMDDDLMADDLANGDLANSGGQADDGDDLQADDHIPNAYRPGAQWVTDPDSGWRRPPPVAWEPAEYGPPPRWHRRLPPGARMVRGPDGRWMVIIPHNQRWVRE